MSDTCITQESGARQTGIDSDDDQWTALRYQQLILVERHADKMCGARMKSVPSADSVVTGRSAGRQRLNTTGFAAFRQVELTAYIESDE